MRIQYFIITKDSLFIIAYRKINGKQLGKVYVKIIFCHGSAYCGWIFFNSISNTNDAGNVNHITYICTYLHTHNVRTNTHAHKWSIVTYIVLIHKYRHIHTKKVVQYLPLSLESKRFANLKFSPK